MKNSVKLVGFVSLLMCLLSGQAALANIEFYEGKILERMGEHARSYQPLVKKATGQTTCPAWKHQSCSKPYSVDDRASGYA